MDVAIGATDVPLPREPLTGGRAGRAALLAVAAALVFGLAGAPARADVGNQPIHYSADKQIWHRKENRVELIGHAAVNQPGETLSADYEVLDLNTHVLDAKGNCVYVAVEATMYGEEMHFNLDTRTGTILGGRVSNDKFTLSGERINKLGEGRFQTHWGEYSTCRDCPRSWTLTAQDVDMEFEGYAYMSNVYSRIVDAPAFWLPYLIVPMKSRRQTGLLFPTFSLSGVNGLQFVLPFFWAINRSSDMTFGLGDYTKRGERVEWEGRYALSPRSGGKANFYYLHDTNFTDEPDGHPINRWALNIGQTQELPFGIEEKLRLTQISDNRYPLFIGDVPGAGERDVSSRLSFSYASSEVSSYVAFEQYRNLLNTNPDPVQRIVQFDPHTVQAFPTGAVTTNDRFLFGTPLVGGLTVGFSNFTRSAGPFDYDGTYTSSGPPGPPVVRLNPVPFGTDPGASGPEFAPGYDPIRKAMRIAYQPSLYTTFRPFDAFSVVPSLRYYGYSYNFGNAVDTLYRGYLLFQTDLSTQIERIYEHPDTPDTPSSKHLVRPILTYSYIPPEFVRQDPNHPFLHQISYATSQNLSGYNFDDYDIVPLDNSPSSQNYFVPLGNSLAMGFTTQWIDRHGKLDDDKVMPTYVRAVELSAGEAINFREYEKGSDNPQPLSRFFSSLGLNLGQFQSGTTYYYYPYIPGIRHQLLTGLSYFLDKGVHQRLFDYDRSIGLAYTWSQVGCTDTTNCGTSNLTGSMKFSLSDYVLPSASVSYSFVGHQLLGAGLAVRFQSPSQCWRFTISLPYQIGVGTSPTVDLALNLTGSGFGGVTEIANQAVGTK